MGNHLAPDFKLYLSVSLRLAYVAITNNPQISVVNRNKELSSFSIHVHLHVGISSAPHHLHPGPHTERAVSMWDAACITAEAKENMALIASAQKWHTPVHTSLAKASHMANPDVQEAEKQKLPIIQGSKCTIYSAPIEVQLNVETEDLEMNTSSFTAGKRKLTLWTLVKSPIIQG